MSTASNVPAGQTTQYRIIRAPRPSVGETILALPQDVVIDMTSTTTKSVIQGDQLPSGLVNFDILFTPSGAVTRAGAQGAQGAKIILWLRDVTQDAATPGEQFLVVVYTRTGLIAVHPVDTTNPTNPYDFATDGKDSGL
jgi:hypothetical protein